MHREQRSLGSDAAPVGVFLIILLAALPLAACAPSGEATGQATVDEAREFVAETEAALLEHWIKSERAGVGAGQLHHRGHRRQSPPTRRAS